jgi:hypothetical protein
MKKSHGHIGYNPLLDQYTGVKINPQKHAELEKLVSHVSLPEAISRVNSTASKKTKK